MSFRKACTDVKSHGKIITAETTETVEMAIAVKAYSRISLEYRMVRILDPSQYRYGRG